MEHDRLIFIGVFVGILVVGAVLPSLVAEWRRRRKIKNIVKRNQERIRNRKENDPFYGYEKTPVYMDDDEVKRLVDSKTGRYKD